MKFRYFNYLFPVIFCLSCSDSPRHTKTINNEIENKILPDKKPSSSFKDTIKIYDPAAVFYSPDSLQLEKIKSVTTARIFNGSMHEYFYLMRNAHFVLRKYYPKLKIIEAKNVRYLLFTRADNSMDCIDLDTKNDAYGLFIFNSKKAPELVDMANIDTELGFYFTK